MTANRLNIKEALSNPKDVFGVPERVLAEPRLDRESKRAILRSWEQDARELAVAEEEGMISGEPNMLHRVLRALEAIAQGQADEWETITKHGNRPMRGLLNPKDVDVLPLVGQVMRPFDEVVLPDQDVREARTRMRRYQVPLLAVVDGDEIVGTISVEDLSASGKGAVKDLGAATVRQVFSPEVAFCYEDDDLQVAEAVMARSGHNHLLVTNRANYLVGYLTSDMIAEAYNRGLPGRPGPAGPSVAGRVVKTAGQAKEGESGKPKIYAVRPKVQK